MTHYWFISTKYSPRAKLALVTFGLAFIVVLLGAYTRLTDAGLSCPDWPHCYGYLTAPHTNAQLEVAAQKYPLVPINVKKAWTEMTHRYFAGIEGTLIIFLAGSILFTRKTKDSKTILIGVGLIALLGIQVTLGMLTVTEKLRPIIVLSHLLTGLSLLSVLWWACLDLKPHPEFFIKKAKPRIVPWLLLGLLVLSAQITLGGWVSSHYAGLACIDFPYCNGKLVPTMLWKQLNNDLVTIHMLHRMGAFITAIYLALMACFLLRHKTLRFVASLILMLLAIQLTLGILNIIWLRPVWIALAHHAVAVLLLLTLISSLDKASYLKEYRYEG